MHRRSLAARLAHVAPALLALAVVLVSGCTRGDDPSSGEDEPAVRLAAAADLLDATSGVRFTLEGEELPDTGTVILGAEGVAAPPSSFEGEFRLLTSGLSTSIEVISIEGQVWARLPLTSDFTPIDPASLGLIDPGVLLDPDAGVSHLLRSAVDPMDAGQVRVGTDVLDQVSATLPGQLVSRVITLADPAADVEATFALDPATGHLRRAVLVGRFVGEGEEQAYVVTLDDHDQSVDIRAPDG